MPSAASAAISGEPIDQPAEPFGHQGVEHADQVDTRMHEVIAVERTEAMPDQGLAQTLAIPGGEFADGDDQPPAPVPLRHRRGVDQARGLVDALLARWGQQVIGAPSRARTRQPLVANQAKHRRVHQALVETERLKQSNQAAQPHPTTARHHRVTKHRNDQGACMHTILTTVLIEDALSGAGHGGACVGYVGGREV